MDRRPTFVAFAVFALVLRGAVPAADFQLGFEGCPTGVVNGDAGEVKTLEIPLTLTTSNNTDTDGPQGWSISVAVDGGTLKSIALKGVQVSTIFDDDGDPSTPLVDPFELDLFGAGFKVAQPATLPADSNVKGAVSAVVLHQTQKMVLQPSGKAQIAKLTVEAAIPAAPAVQEVSIRFVNGLKGLGQPVNNVVTFKGVSVTPNLTECRFQLRQQVVDQEFDLALLPEGSSSVPIEGGFGVYEKSFPVGDQLITTFVTLTTRNLTGTDGPQGWSLSVANESCAPLDSVAVKGVHASTIFDEDGDPSTPLVDPFDLDLFGAGFKVAQPASLPSDQNVKGAVSAVVLHQTQKMVLHPNATDTILKLVYRVNVTSGRNPDCKITFTDGLKGLGQPVNNVITHLGTSRNPTSRQGLILRLTGTVTAQKDNFVRGDANNDGTGGTGLIDVSDAIYIVFNVIPALKSTGDYEIPCRDAGDANDDGLLNLPDAIYLLDWLFRGSNLPPPAPFPNCGTVASSDTTGCPPASACGAPGR